MQLGPTSQFKDVIKQFLTIRPSNSPSQTSNHKRLELTIESFTKTKECWEAALNILNTQTDNNVLTLTSSILKNKFQYDFGQLTEEMFQRVHHSLIQIVNKFQKPSGPVRINLAVSIAIIYIHKFEEIGQLMPYLCNQFLSNSDRNYLFTVLEVLPEEVDNDKIVVEEDKRLRLKSYLESIQTKVLVELNNISQQQWNNGQLKKTILVRCFSNWIRIHTDPNVIKSLSDHFMLGMVFQGLSNTDISRDCGICIQHIMRSILNPQQYITIYSFCAHQVISYFPKIHRWVTDEQFEMAEEMVKIVCVFGISSKELFTSNMTQDYKEFVKNMVILSQNLEIELSVYMMEFWVSFLSTILDKGQAIEFYRDDLEKLYLVLANSLKLEEHECAQLNTLSAAEFQRKNEFFDEKVVFRGECKVLFNLLAEILAPQKCLELSVASMLTIQQNAKDYWTQIECYLNPLEQVIQQLAEPSQCLNSLVSKLVEMDAPYQTVKKTIIRVLSSCSKIYSKNDQFALKIFSYLINYLKDPEMMNISSKAFENLCVHNIQFVLVHIDSFIKTLLVYKNNQQILNGIVKVISRNPQALNKYLNEIFSLYVQDLPEASTIKEAKTVLDKIILIFDITNKSAKFEEYSVVMDQCFKEVWTMIKPILSKKCSTYDEDSLLEKCTKVIKYAMRCLHHNFLPYVEEIYSVIINSYQTQPKSSYVYMVEVLITVYYRNPDFVPYIKNLFDKVIQITFTYLSSMEGLMDQPQLAEDFFGLLSRTLRFMPEVFFSSQSMLSILEFIVSCCGIQDGEIARIFYTFLIDFFMQFWDRNLAFQYLEVQGLLDNISLQQSSQLQQTLSLIQPLVLKHTPLILQKIFAHLETGPSSTVRESIENVLVAEIKAFPRENRDIWIAVLTPIEEDILTVNEKNKLVGAVSELSQENIEFTEQTFYLVTKRYLHRLIRTPI